MILPDQQFPAAFHPFREVGMQVHDHLAMHTVRAADKSNRQIYRLAVWRA